MLLAGVRVWTTHVQKREVRDKLLVYCFLSQIAFQIFGGIFRCYAILIAILVAVAETEWDFIFKFWRVSLSFVESASIFNHQSHSASFMIELLR